MFCVCPLNHKRWLYEPSSDRKNFLKGLSETKTVDIKKKTQLLYGSSEMSPVNNQAHLWE
jgi:hypothetical protein